MTSLVDHEYEEVGVNTGSELGISVDLLFEAEEVLLERDFSGDLDVTTGGDEAFMPEEVDIPRIEGLLESILALQVSLSRTFLTRHYGQINPKAGKRNVNRKETRSRGSITRILHSCVY